MLCSALRSAGSAAYCELALHLKLVFATARDASATTLVPAVLVGYLCFTPLAKALQSTVCKYSGVVCASVLWTVASE